MAKRFGCDISAFDMHVENTQSVELAGILPVAKFATTAVDARSKVNSNALVARLQ